MSNDIINNNPETNDKLQILKNPEIAQNVIFTYNGGVDAITTSDIYGALELSARRHIKDFECLADLETKCSSAKFNILLQDIGTIFKNTKALIVTQSTNRGNNYIYNNNITWEYDKYKLLALVPVYTNLCYEFDKRVSLQGFLFFCGIGNVNYFTYTEKNNAKLSDNLRAKIAEFLAENDNELQKARARDSNQAILQLAYNNHVHGWSGEIKRKEINATVKTLEDIKKQRAELTADDGQIDNLTL